MQYDGNAYKKRSLAHTWRKTTQWHKKGKVLSKLKKVAAEKQVLLAPPELSD